MVKSGFSLLLYGSLLLAGAGCSSLDPQAKVKEEPFVIHGQGKDGDEKDLAREVERIFRYYGNLFGVREGEIPRLAIYLDSRDADFESEQYPARYETTPPSIHFHREPDSMLLMHEIAHHFIQTRLGSVPTWLHEGLAVYLGWSAMDDKRILVGEIPVAHYKTLKTSLREETLYPFSKILSLSHESFYHEGQSTRFYSESWGIVFYIFHGYLPPRLSFNASGSMAPDEIILTTFLRGSYPASPE